MSFQYPIDIANRALDHVGQDPINSALGFDENSKKARLTGRLYDKLRLAEIQRRPWAFATVETILRALDVNTMKLVPTLWNTTTTFFVGSIVAYGGVLWVSLKPDNLNNEPNVSDAWTQYFGPLTVMLYDSTVTYNNGELVYTAPGDGTYRVYQSKIFANDDDPEVATAYDATVTYFKNQVVTDAAIAYMSLVDLNTGNTPLTSPTQWTTSFVGGQGSLNWLQIGGAEFPMGVALETMNIVYPLGAGPASQSSTRNAYHLPANFLRKLSNDPKAGSTSYLGAAWNLSYQDWKVENGFIVSSENGPIMVRFIADIVDVKKMPPMFCEGLAARLALDICEPLTQSSDKLDTIADLYRHFMTEAGTVDAIDRGPEEFPLDDYIQCRA